MNFISYPDQKKRVNLDLVLEYHLDTEKSIRFESSSNVQYWYFDTTAGANEALEFVDRKSGVIPQRRSYDA